MKEWLFGLLWVLGISLFDRRKMHAEMVHDERRRVTAKKAQKMLHDSIDRFSDAMDKYGERHKRH